MSRPAYSGYRPSGVEWLGHVPQCWELNRLKTVANYWVSGVDKVPSDEELPVRLCNYTDVYYNDHIRPDMDLMETTASEDEIRRFGLQVGDVLLTKDSEDWSDIGVASLVVETAPDLVCGYHLAIVRPRTNALDGAFLFRAIQSSSINQQFQVAASGVTRFGLPKSAIGDAWLPIPPLPEQRAIAAFLDAQTARIDTLVAKKRELIAKLREKRAALISRTVTRGLPPDAARAAGFDPHPRLMPSGIEWLGEVPEHWEVSKIKYTAVIESGHTPSRSVEEYWTDCFIPWVSLNDSGYLREHDYITETSHQINELGLMNSSARLLPPGAVIFSRDATVGLCAITTVPMAVSQHFVAYVPGPKLLPNFLLLSLKAMSQHLEMLSFGSTIATIGMPEVRSLVCPLPPLAEQQGIVDYLRDSTSKIDQMIERVTEAILRLQEYRTAIITAAVTGKIDVRNALATVEAETPEAVA